VEFLEYFVGLLGVLLEVLKQFVRGLVLNLRVLGLEVLPDIGQLDVRVFGGCTGNG
jgi:hypothetical protein